MRTKLDTLLRLCLAMCFTVSGCALQHSTDFVGDPDLEYYKTAATQIEFPDVESPAFAESASIAAPLTLSTADPPEYWPLTLNDAIQLALRNSRTLRDLGGLVIQAPQAVRTVMDPALAETDPRFGTEAALSAFDSSFEASAFFEKNDRALNNVFFGGGTRMFLQDLHAYTAEISKTSATGADFSMRQIINYDQNNSPGNDDPSRPWTIQLESEVRQPLMQGAGVDFNRIAGPQAAPGVINGVLVARINSDISLADFEVGVRNLISDLESTYWELYFAYRDLDAKVSARDLALETWRSIYALFVTERRGGEAEKEAQAREQFFRLEEEVQNALAGRAQDRVRTIVFRGAGGVHGNERRLRMMMGIPVNDGRLIRPADEPVMAKVVFLWDEIVSEALTRRPELRRQKWHIKRNELELVAARNFLLPRIDAVGRYRFRGLGHDLLNPARQQSRFDNALQDMTTGDWQEWMMGLEVSFPFGYRQANAAVRHAELQLARSQAILAEQERFVSLELSDSVAEVDRAYITSQTNYNRRLAGHQQLAALAANYEVADQNEKTRLLDLLLDSQRRFAEAESNYYRTLVEYTLAIKNVHLNKGSLLEYNQVFLSEGPWPDRAYSDAEHRERHRHDPPKFFNRLLSRPEPVSQGGLIRRRIPPHQAEPMEPILVQPPVAREWLPTPEVNRSDETRLPGATERPVRPPGQPRRPPEALVDPQSSADHTASRAEPAERARRSRPIANRLPQVTPAGRASGPIPASASWRSPHAAEAGGVVPADFQPFSRFEQLAP